MQSEENIAGDLSGRTIIIIGTRHLQNCLLSRYLADETGVAGHTYESLDESGMEGLTHDPEPKLILMDCLGMDMSTILTELNSLSKTFLSSHLISLFNMDPQSGYEEKALSLGVRGFFYEKDSLLQIVKGIRTIFSNELWVSREILTKCILDKSIDIETDVKKGNLILTAREIEILNYVAAGTKNEEIAEKLFISPNTVRTHIYNIFKKIDVPNRLQAALWAVQNL